MIIKDPKFDLYEFVIFHWNDRATRAKVVRRWFNANDECWFYQLQGEWTNAHFYPEQAIEIESEIRSIAAPIANDDDIPYDDIPF